MSDVDLPWLLVSVCIFLAFLATLTADQINPRLSRRWYNFVLFIIVWQLFVIYVASGGLK